MHGPWCRVRALIWFTDNDVRVNLIKIIGMRLICTLRCEDVYFPERLTVLELLINLTNEHGDRIEECVRKLEI